MSDLRSGVTLRQLDYACAMYRLERYGRSDTVSAEAVQPIGSLSARDRQLDQLDDVDSQRYRAMRLAADEDERQDG